MIGKNFSERNLNNLRRQSFLIVFLLTCLLIPFVKAYSQISNEITIVQGVYGDAVGMNKYVPGSTINVTITFNKNTSETVTALGFTCLLPAGWQYQGGTNQPPIAPSVGTASNGVNPLEFAWLFVPAFPFTLSFGVKIPSSAQGPGQIQSQALYRLTGGQLYSNIETFNFIGEYSATPEGAPEGTPEGTIEGSSEGETINTVQGVVINSISKKPVAGVTVEISIADKQSTAPVVTDANGKFSFPNLGTLQPPYRLDFTKRKYKPKTVQPIASGANVLVELEPGNIQVPSKPRVYSGPRSVRIGWDANPEYNIAGYNVYRRVVGIPVWERLNNPTAQQPYEGYIKGLEFEDKTVQPSTYYEYAIQAVSDVDRYTSLSPVSDQVKGQFLTIFFPDDVAYKDAGLYLWERNPQDPQQWLVRIPVNSKSVYDVSATSVQIDAELPSDLLLDMDTMQVEPSGITVGMMISANAIYTGAGIYNVRIAAAGVEGGSLYGVGTLFNIFAKPNLDIEGTQCRPLHLIPDDNAGNGVRLYDVANTGEINSQTKPLDLELEDGQLCITGGCIHGDADNNKVVEKADAQYVLSYWVKKVPGNECILKSGDINMDGLVDSADSSLIQRWLAGKNITPPKLQGLNKNYDNYIQDVLWLADAGSLSAEAILANLEKSDVSVNVWLSEALTGEPGTQKTISVLADNVANISGFAMVLNFDKDRAQVDSVELGPSASGLELVYNDDVNAIGSLRISAAGEENLGVKGEGIELVKIQFTMIGDGGNADLVLAQVRINDIYAYVPMFNDPKAPKILQQEPTPEGEGTIEGTPEGTTEGTPEGVVEGTPEGTTEGTPEGVVEGTPEGITEGTPEGVVEGTPEGTPEGEGEPPSNKVTVPNVVGKTEAEARNIITSAGLTVGKVTQEYSKDVPKGKVIRQAPTAGSQVDRGTAVDLVISKGAKRRFIISCGSGMDSDSSHIGDIVALGLVSGLLLLRWRKVAPFMNN